MPAAMDAAAQMRVLTVRQPWAWAIIHGGKDVENRTRNLAGAYRGPVAIHVAGKYAEAGSICRRSTKHATRGAVTTPATARCSTRGSGTSA